MTVKREKEVEEYLELLSSGTRRVYEAGLKHFQAFLSETGRGTISSFLDCVEEDMLKPRREKTMVASKTLSEFMKWLQNGKANKTVNVYVAAVQALANYKGLTVNLKHVKRPPSVAVYKKHPWTIEEIDRFVSLMQNIQYKSIATAIVQSGLSVSDLLALTYADIRGEFEKGVSPLCLDLSRRKTGVPFITFLGSWALHYLKLHLEGRSLEDDTPIYNVTSRAVDRYFAAAGGKFGKFKGRNPYSPHSLRAAFRTFLSDRKVDHLYIEFWMGHRVPEQQIVYVSKSREGWRETYRTMAEPWLTPPSFDSDSDFP